MPVQPLPAMTALLTLSFIFEGNYVPEAYPPKALKAWRFGVIVLQQRDASVPLPLEE